MLTIRHKPCARPSPPSADYRLNYRLHKACATEVNRLDCVRSCSAYEAAGSVTCHGTVLRCLQDKMGEITSEECRAEVFAFEEMEVRDFRADLPFAEACRCANETVCGTVGFGDFFVET
jgi:Golgi apparatus protein 1